MAAYDSLSAEDKAVIDNFTNVMRSTAGEVARVFNHMAAIAEDVNAVSIFVSLDADEIIPNRSGLAGADSMTKAQLLAVFNNFGTMETVNNTTSAREVWTQMCGIVNMIG
jgi:hypothetical protein